jgi:hypothetical protein
MEIKMLGLRKKLNVLEAVEDVSWFRIGYEDMHNMKSFNPPSHSGASSYLAGWIAAEGNYLMRFFTDQ